jgi:hypothetical protein
MIKKMCKVTLITFGIILITAALHKHAIKEDVTEVVRYFLPGFHLLLFGFLYRKDYIKNN